MSRWKKRYSILLCCVPCTNKIGVISNRGFCYSKNITSTFSISIVGVYMLVSAVAMVLIIVFSVLICCYAYRSTIERSEGLDHKAVANADLPDS